MKKKLSPQIFGIKSAIDIGIYKIWIRENSPITEIQASSANEALEEYEAGGGRGFPAGNGFENVFIGYPNGAIGVGTILPPKKKNNS